MLCLSLALSVYFYFCQSCIRLCISLQRKADFFSKFSVVAVGPYEDVVKLQTMRCLFEAYEHVLSLLENVFTPMFCHSDEVSLTDLKC